MLRLLVSLALICLLLRIVSLAQIVALFRSADSLLFAAAILVAALDRALMAAKWFPLLRAQMPDSRLLPAMRAYWASSFAALVLLNSVGGDVVRALALGGASRKTLEVGASILSERLLGMLASGALCFLALILAWQASVRLDVFLPWAIFAIVSALAVFFLPLTRWVRESEDVGLRRGRWLRRLSRFGNALAVYRRRPALLTVVTILSVAEQMIPAITLWILSHAIGAPIAFRALLTAVPLTLFVSRLPISMWGLGVIEVSLVYLLGLFGVAPAEALALSLAGRVVEMIAVLPGSVFWYEVARSARATTAVRPESAPPA
jgi:uncharacterized protein (TIRG00374 family)